MTEALLAILAVVLITAAIDAWDRYGGL